MLTQEEAVRLLRVLKTLVKKGEVVFPQPTKDLQLDIESMDGKSKFIIDINRKKLLRIDIDGLDHGNPDGEVIPCPHIHIYREGFKLSWAYPLSDFINADSENLIETFIEFLKYNKINDIPQVRYQDTLF